MANKKISELQSRTPALSDLMLVGDPSSGYSYKCTVTALATIIETDIADGYVTIGTTQTISGAKTFSNNLTLTSVVNTPTDPDKFLTLNASNVVTYRTGAEVLSDIGGVGGSGTTNYLPKFSATTTLANSQIFDNGTNVGIGVGSSIIAGYLLTIGGKVKIYNQIDLDNPTTNTCNAINIQKGTSISHRGVGYIQIASFNTNRLSLFFNDNNNYQADFDGSNLTTGQRYILPNATGTLALTSDLSSYVPTSRILTINGTSYDLSANRTWSVGTVTSVAALTLGTTGTDLSSSVANGTTTPVITLNIPTASATNRGALSSTDWSTFNNKQSTITLTTTGSSGSATFVSNTLNVPTYTLAGLGGISGTGTTNYIPKFTGSTSIGNSVIYESSGSVGINTITPNATLEVNGSLNVTDGTSTIRIINSGGLGLFGTVGSHPLVFRTVNTERMRLDASGNLGIGISSPAAKLDVYQSSTTQTLMRIEIPNVAQLNIGNGGNSLNYYDGNTQIFRSGTGTERMRITSGGNVLVGTTSASTTGAYGTPQFSIESNIFASSQIMSHNNTSGNFSFLGIGKSRGTGAAPTIVADGEIVGAIAFYGYDGASYRTTAGITSIVNGTPGSSDMPGALIFNTTADGASSFTERMRLTSSGELLINTTSDAGDYKLQVNGNYYGTGNAYLYQASTDADIRLETGGTGTGARLRLKTTAADWYVYTNQGSTDLKMYNGSDLFTLSSAGNLTLSGSIKTAAPSGGTAAAWKLGERVASSGLTLNDTQYIQLDIAGTLYTLATVNLP
jgi:predicted heme/steroid binding protein